MICGGAMLLGPGGAVRRWQSRHSSSQSSGPSPQPGQRASLLGMVTSLAPLGALPNKRHGQGGGWRQSADAVAVPKFCG
jgi:hypothetical protein